MEKPILFSYFRSSASFRVRIALNLKSIDYEYRPIHLLRSGGEQRTDSYSSLNPSKEVPCLIHEGKALAQSMAIIDYLEAIAPEPRLFPEDAFGRARVVQACEIVNSGIQPLQNLKVLQHLESCYGLNQGQKEAWAQHWIKQGLNSLESFLLQRPGDFALGSQPTAADVFLVPQVVASRRFKVDTSAYTQVTKVFERCMSLEAFEKAAPEKQPDFEP